MQGTGTPTPPPTSGPEYFTCNFDADECQNALIKVPPVNTAPGSQGQGPEFDWTRKSGEFLCDGLGLDLQGLALC